VAIANKYLYQERFITLQLEGERYADFAPLAALLPTHRIDEDPTTKQHLYIHSLERREFVVAGHYDRNGID
jgi:hypothetical protein